MKHLIFRFSAVAIVVIAILLIHTSCNETETTDSTSFILYYTDMTDIGPSMSGIISSPTYKGSTPSDFSITGVTLNGEVFSGDSFTINANTGAISIENTKGISVGLYKLTISCVSTGKLYEYKDIVSVNMMKPVPDGITVEPDILEVEYISVVDATNATELPTAQVVTNGNHVSIAKYEIANSEHAKFFAISSTGEISIIKGNQDILPGIYVLSLKLTTGASADDEGIFENALTINITSKPLALTYTPAMGKIEEESQLSGNTSFTGNAPELKGSPEGLKYVIGKVTPETDKIRIDDKTGALSVAFGHGLVAGSKYTVNIKVFNNFTQEGVDFENAFELEVVEYIEPISGFTYTTIEEIQAIEFDVLPDATFKGDEVRFEFVDLPAELHGQLTLDRNGVVKAVQGNTIPLGRYIVKVRATNPKSDPEHPTIASFTLTIMENQNYFTYVRYGNNLDLSPSANYANQFRLITSTSLSGLMPETDAKVSLTYELTGIQQASNMKIDPITGEVSITAISSTQCGIGIITATAGKGTKAEVSVKTPIFFHYSAKIRDNMSTDQIEVHYTPFVLQVNPRTGGRSVVPTITGVTDMSKFAMDYRRTFNYYNYSGVHTSGQPSVSGSFMSLLWDSYAEAIGGTPSYGAKSPMSYYENTKSGASLTNALAYVDAANFAVVVNPNKWVYKGEYANGFMSGQITITSDVSQVNNGGQTFPIILWFDTKFNN